MIFLSEFMLILNEFDVKRSEMVHMNINCPFE